MGISEVVDIISCIFLLDLEDTVKKIFSNSKGRRTLPGEVTKRFRSRKGFLDFCEWIETNI